MHSPGMVLDGQCGGKVPLGKLHCPVINVSNQLHDVGSTVNFCDHSSHWKGHLKTLVWNCCIFIWQYLICVKCTKDSQPHFFFRKIKGAMWQKWQHLFSITTAIGSKIPYSCCVRAEQSTAAALPRQRNRRSQLSQRERCEQWGFW